MLKEKLPIFLINTLFLNILLLALTNGQNDRQRNKYTCCAWAGGPESQFVVNSLSAIEGRDHPLKN